MVLFGSGLERRVFVTPFVPGMIILTLRMPSDAMAGQVA